MQMLKREGWKFISARLSCMGWEIGVLTLLERRGRRDLRLALGGEKRGRALELAFLYSDRQSSRHRLAARVDER
jgi:Holliday junction resolvase-like predicted endonuclease